MSIKKIKRKENDLNQKDADLFLKKHVGLIHCENKLTLIQRKICNILLFNALDKMTQQEIHEISLRKLCSLVGYNSNDSKLIKESIKSLISVVMEWNLLEDSKFINEETYSEEAISWNASSLLAGASIRNGLVQYSYSPQIKSVLSSLEIYGRINLFVQAKFNSAYSLVLYENCVRFKNIKQTTSFPVELFRALMGVPKDKYLEFKEFKRNVINVAVKEINEKSDIYVEPQFRKMGRTITGVQFLLSENENYKPIFKKIQRDSESPLQQKANGLELLMNDFNIAAKQAAEIMETYAYDYLLEKINLVKSKKNVSSKGAYLISALKKDYSLQKKPATRVPAENSYLREAKAASEIFPLKNKYMAYKLKTYNEFIQNQEAAIQLKIREMFADSLEKNSETFRFYKKSGLSSPFVIAEYIHFIESNYADLIGNHLSFEDYISSEENEIFV